MDASKINVLKGKMIENGFNTERLAESINMNRATLYRKLKSGGDTFTLQEAKSIAEALKLTTEETASIFLQ